MVDISDGELVYKDQWGGISIMHASNLSVRTLMSNQTLVSLEIEMESTLFEW